MKKMRLLWNNLWDIGTVTASSENVEFPAINTQHPWFKRHWRSLAADSSGEWLRNDLLDAYDVYGCFIKFHNFQVGSASINIQATDDPMWGHTHVDLAIPVTSEIMGIFFPKETYQYWGLSLLDVNPDGYLKIGRVFLGDYFEFYYGHSKRKQTIIDPSDIVENEDGEPAANIRTHRRKHLFTWDAVPAADLVSLTEIFDAVGQSKEYFLCQDADSLAIKTYYGRNKSDWEFDPVVINYDGFSIDFEESK